MRKKVRSWLLFLEEQQKHLWTVIWFGSVQMKKANPNNAYPVCCWSPRTDLNTDPLLTMNNSSRWATRPFLQAKPLHEWWHSTNSQRTLLQHGLSPLWCWERKMWSSTPKERGFPVRFFFTLFPWPPLPSLGHNQKNLRLSRSMDQRHEHLCLTRINSLTASLTWVYLPRSPSPGSVRRSLGGVALLLRQDLSCSMIWAIRSR